MSQQQNSRKIIHIDMDCFYAAIEMRDHPELREKPIAVGGLPDERGVLCTSNYIARQYGVRSAMSSAYARRLCPQLLILPVDMPKYRAVSRQIRQIFQEYTPWVEPLSLDEAYLDVTHVPHCHNSATRIAEEIRQRIFAVCQLTASAGVAPNKFLAKVASEINKPNGQYVIAPQQVSHFIKRLAVNKIYGVGRVTARKMAQLGIKTCADLQAKNRADLEKQFGKFGGRLYELCRGTDDRPVEPNRVRKSISVEHTFIEDLPSLTACLAVLPELVLALKKRLQHCSERKITSQFVKIKFHDFSLTTVEHSRDQLSEKLFQQLMSSGYRRRAIPVRLLGIGVSFAVADNIAPTQGELDF